VPSGTDLPLDGLDSPLELVVKSSAFFTCFLGRPASPRPVGLALARLGPPLLCHVDPRSCDASQVGSGFGSSLIVDPNSLGAWLSILNDCTCVQLLIFA
jgi:hypothetical protein